MQSCSRWLPCLSCPISCSTTPGITCMSSAHHPHNVWMTRERDFIGDFGWWMTSSRMSSAHCPQAGMLSAWHPQACMSSACRLQAHMSSAHHLQNSSWSAWTWTIFLLWQELVIEWNLSQQCWVVSFQDHVNDLWHNLCWWFSLHVTSGHCSHVICICTCHPHIIWAYAYYAHIICSGPWYIPS